MNKVNSSKKIIITLLLLITIILIAVLIKNSSKLNKDTNNISKVNIKEQDIIQKEIINNSKAKNDDINHETSIKKNNEINPTLKITKDDIILGNIKAPITMIEYASLSCPHCAYFIRDAFPKLNKEFIETGFVKFIYRDFPLDKTALIAGSIAKCHALNNPENKVKDYYNMVKLYFNSQNSWAGHEDFISKLQAISQIEGMELETFNKCLSKNEIQEQILLRRIEASKNLKISSTPTFFINGKMFSGFTDYVKIKNIIENELQALKDKL